MVEDFDDELAVGSCHDVGAIVIEEALFCFVENGYAVLPPLQ